MSQDDIAAMREEYGSADMRREDMLADPITQFSQWFDSARAAELHEPNALTLSTIGLDGCPAARTVLMKAFDVEGFVIYTNYKSAKAQEIAANPRGSMLFQWLAQQRQVRIEGTIEKVSREESEAYFSSRPRESQIGAWVSHQSTVVASRDVLLSRIEEIETRFAGQDVPLPDFWGGYRLRPVRVEFWQGGKGRVHDRLLYSKVDGESSWVISRLAP